MFEQSNLIDHVMQMIAQHEVKFGDFRFCDMPGKEMHITLPVSRITEELFSEGIMFDGSSIKGFKEINESDMLLLPDPSTVVLDPFCHQPTLNFTCDVLEPTTMTGFERAPRSIAKRAENYLKATGIADVSYFGPEPEFFIFDDVRSCVSISEVSYSVNSKEGAWNSETMYEGGNIGHRPKIKEGYFPVPPVDSSQDLRSVIALTLEKVNIEVEAHHHEVATANQNEIATRFNRLTTKADELLRLKYVIHNVVHAHGKTATFMPKPLVGDNGSGMHLHISLMKDGVNLFAGDQYAGLSQLALYFMGGVIFHARALNAFTNATTNSYKRLVPGFEAPILLAYSSRNRSAAIRIPHVVNPKGRRIEVRFPDPAINPYLAFSAVLMAGLDGIRQKIHPGEPMEKNLYDLPPEEIKDIPTVCATLQEALTALEADHEFLLEGGVFTEDLIDAYIEIKNKEVILLNSTTHPIEIENYYSL